VLKPYTELAKTDPSAIKLGNICIYCGSSSHVDEVYKQTARNVAAAIAQSGMNLIYGGGHVGLMGLVADSALSAGGKVIGIIPEHIRAHEVQHTGLTEMIVVDSMHKRKDLMAEKADAFVVLPGGLGTLDETFEILTWKQLGLHTKPVVFYNVNGYWDPMIKLIQHIVDQHFAIPGHLNLYKVVSSIDEMFTVLAGPPEQSIDPEDKWR
jgi:uncharacterized protein (TIGR00730 family)